MTWSVVRVNDDGRTVLVNGGMCWIAADKVAGALRDQQSEADVAAGWNVLARKASRPRDGAAPRFERESAAGVGTAKGGRGRR